MSELNLSSELQLIEAAMANFIADVVVSKSKKRRMHRNMECRRKLEEKQEEKRLKRETCEYEFEHTRSARGRYGICRNQ